MANEVEHEAVDPGTGLGSCLMWFVWGGSISFLSILSLVLLLLLAASASLNLYLGWQMSGLEVAISRPGSTIPGEAPGFIPTEVLALIPTNTPPVTVLTSTPLPLVDAQSPLEVQVATLSALATQVAVASAGSDDTASALLLSTATPVPAVAPPVIATPPPPPTAVPPAIPIDPSGGSQASSGSEAVESQTSPAPEAEAANPTLAPAGEAAAVQAAEVPYSALTSSNVYTLIPLDGERESRPAAEHGDLNLLLREPQPIQTELSLIDIADAGSDSNAPNLGHVFEPNFVNAYTVHDWDWGCNCKGPLLRQDHLVLVGIKTTPGEPVFIPTKEQDMYQGKYYATLLYASEDSVTFLYDRKGTVIAGYTVHYLGLRTDPNLLKLYRESKGNQLPGLTLDTPVGIATDEIIVAIRDNGTFMDARSRKDWWD